MIAAQNIVTRINYVKPKIDISQQNTKCRLCGDRDEAINYIINECSKVAQKEYKTRHDWVGKVIHWELCKNVKFDYTKKWYMHNSESVQKKEMHKVFWDFEMQTDQLIFARRSDQVIVNQKREPAEF